MRPCKQEHGNDGNSDRCCGCHQCTTDNDQRRNRKHDKGPGFRSNRANCYIVASRRCGHQNCHFRAVALQRILQSPASRVGRASTGPPNGGSKLAGRIGRSFLPGLTDTIQGVVETREKTGFSMKTKVQDFAWYRIRYRIDLKTEVGVALIRANPVSAKLVTGLHQTLGGLRVAFSQAVLLEVDLMARIPKIWFRKDRKCWQVTIRGVRHNLGPNKKEATDRFHQLMGTAHHKPIRSMSFTAIADAYLEWVKTNRAASTYAGNRFHIERFCQRYPDLQLGDLRPYHCQQWVDAYPKLAQTTRRIYLKAIRRLVNWAIQQGYISGDPLRGKSHSADRGQCVLSATDQTRADCHEGSGNLPR